MEKKEEPNLPDKFNFNLYLSNDGLPLICGKWSIQKRNHQLKPKNDDLKSTNNFEIHTNFPFLKTDSNEDLKNNNITLKILPLQENIESPLTIIIFIKNINKELHIKNLFEVNIQSSSGENIRKETKVTFNPKAHYSYITFNDKKCIWKELPQSFEIYFEIEQLETIEFPKITLKDILDPKKPSRSPYYIKGKFEIDVKLLNPNIKRQQDKYKYEGFLTYKEFEDISNLNPEECFKYLEKTKLLSDSKKNNIKIQIDEKDISKINVLYKEEEKEKN